MTSDGILITELVGATLAVPEPERTTEAFAGAFDWIVHDGSVLEDRWSLLEPADPEATIMGPPEATRGFVRLIRAATTEPRGAVPRAWSSIEPIVRDLGGLVEKLDRHPDFEIRVPITEVDMRAHESNIHRAALVRVDDCLFILTMAVTQPANRAFPESPSRVGHVFAVHIRSTEADPARHLFTDVLGMRPLMVVDGNDNLIHHFWGVDRRHPVRMDVLQGTAEGLGLGAVEVQAWPRGYLGRPVTESIPPGIAAATFHAPDLAAARAAVAEAGVRVVGEDTGGFIVRGTDGELLEITGSGWI